MPVEMTERYISLSKLLIQFDAEADDGIIDRNDPKAVVNSEMTLSFFDPCNVLSEVRQLLRLEKPFPEQWIRAQRRRIDPFGRSIRSWFAELIWELRRACKARRLEAQGGSYGGSGLRTHSDPGYNPKRIAY